MISLDEEAQAGGYRWLEVVLRVIRPAIYTPLSLVRNGNDSAGAAKSVNEPATRLTIQ